MPIGKANLETIINMLTALTQRQETVRHLASQLHAATIWRSPDGRLAVDIPDAEKVELEVFIKAYLDESEALIAAVRAMLGASE